jgi:S-adenosylmethionine:diacylglycerol 3-amino-3-carboxypropyl transferase
MYEDPSIELEVFRGKRRIFTIASAGCTARALATAHDVVACDINPAQLAYAERRSAGEPYQPGEAERAMHYARALAPLAGWRTRMIDDFLNLSDPQLQFAFWRERLDTWAFRTGFDALLSRPILSLVYSSGLLAVLPRPFGPVLRDRFARTFALHPNASNPFAKTLLRGDPPEPDASPPPRPIQFVLSDAVTYLESAAPGSFDGFTLSNILDGASPAYCERLHAAVRNAAAPQASVVLRSFAQPRTSHPNLAARDRSLLWGSVEVYMA